MTEGASALLIFVFFLEELFIYAHMRIFSFKFRNGVRVSYSQIVGVSSSLLRSIFAQNTRSMLFATTRFRVT